MGGFAFTGLSGGLDVQGLVSQIMFAERAPIRRIDTRISNFESKITAYNDLNSRLSELLATIENLNQEDSFAARKTTSSAETVLTASATSAAVEGTYQITVGRLALYDNFVSGASFQTATEAIGTGSFDLTVGSTVTTITVDSTNNTLDGLRKAINDSGADVTAAIVNDGTGYRLTITSKASGSASAISIANNTLTLSDGSTPLTFSRTHAIATEAELDAQLTVNGLSVTSSSNTVEGVIEGVTLNLRDTSASTVTLQVTNDTDTVEANLTAFVEAYNKVYSYINGQFQYVEGVGSGTLAGEYILRDLQGQLAQIVGGSVSGVSGLSSLGLLGIQMQNDGTLSIDSSVLDENLAENFDAVKSLFVALGTPSHSKVSYVTAGSETQAGTYQVDITALAEAATITSPNSIGGTLGIDETLIFTMGSKTSQVLLSSGMDLDTIVDTLNAAFDADGLSLTATKSGSQLVVTSDQVGHHVSFSVVSDVDSGGTGIGTSGLSDAGASVAGTFTNLATMEVYSATGNGNLLEATEGDAKGLQISFSGTATGTYGSVSFTVGIAEQLDRLLTRTTDSLEGPIHNAVEGYQSDIKSMEQDIEALEQRLLQREQYLIQQFSKANEALQQMQFLQASLSSQLAALL